MLYVGTLELATDSPRARARRCLLCTLGGSLLGPECVRWISKPAESIAPYS